MGGGREGIQLKSKPPPSLPNNPPISHYKCNATGKLGPQRTISAQHSRKFCTFIACPLKWARIYKEARVGFVASKWIAGLAATSIAKHVIQLAT